ncbi:MAG: dihydroorotase [Bacteroidales bacterium]|nr:dihydroorotase [Bacteroidales bacterium]
MKPIAYFITHAQIINEERVFEGDVLVQDGVIRKVADRNHESIGADEIGDAGIIDAEGLLLMPGVIDDQVHFREPGLTDKADIQSESRAAVAGGITSFMEMPNTSPPVLTQELLEQKYQLAAEKSLANFSFYMGTSNENAEETLRTNPRDVCGIKIFLGSSTGNMLVDNIDTLNTLFSKSRMLIAVHCEDETTIRKNLEIFREKYGREIPAEAHPLIRSSEACYKSTRLATGLAKVYHTRLHVLHLSTAREMSLFDNHVPLERKKITAEVCIHHLWFNNTDYGRLGNRIKWNPAVKTREDQQALLSALLDDRIDVIATDHAPHTLEEKNRPYLQAPSGGPMVQHALLAMLDLWHEGRIPLETVVRKMCHAPAVCFQVDRRGFIREGYHADLVLVDPARPSRVEKSNLLYKCGWSPLEGHSFRSTVTHTFVNGHLAFHEGRFDESVKGRRLLFNRKIN